MISSFSIPQLHDRRAQPQPDLFLNALAVEGRGPNDRILPPFVTRCLELQSILLRGCSDEFRSFAAANPTIGFIRRRRALAW